MRMIQDDKKNGYINKKTKSQDMKEQLKSKEIPHAKRLKVPKQLIRSISSVQDSRFTNAFPNSLIKANRILEKVNRLSLAMSPIILNSPITESVLQITDSYKQIFNKNYMFIEMIKEINQGLLSSYRVDYSKLFSSLSDIISNPPMPYTKEEFKEIAKKLESLADKGWVVHYYQYKLYVDLDVDDISSLEEYWLDLLRQDLSNEAKVDKIRSLECFSSPLIISMKDSYHVKNYYAAYTLASLAIDGTINRLSEIISEGKTISVGFRAVKEIDKKIGDKQLSDVGMMRWLYNFFKDTNRFTLDKPNRHMISHGRWEGEITEEMFLQLFNVMLYIYDNYNHWVEAIQYDLTT